MPEQVDGGPARRRGGVRGVIARGVGMLGVWAGVALTVAVLVGHGHARARVGEIAGTLDAGLARGLLPLASARERVGGVETLLDDVGAAVRARAADSERLAGARETLLAKTAALSDRYLTLRSAYAEGRERLVAMLERLRTLDEALPGVAIPAGPAEALGSLDLEVRDLDTRVQGLLAAVPAEGLLEQGLVTSVEAIRGTLGRVGSGLDGARARMEGLRAEVADAVVGAQRLLMATALALTLLLLYGVFLHVVLYRWGGGGGLQSSAPRG